MIAAVVAGVALGVYSRVVDYFAPDWAGNSLALWLLVACVVGLGSRSWWAGAARGCLALVVASSSYYAWRLFVMDDIGIRFATRAFAFWTALAVTAGFVAGGFAHRGREAFAVPAGGFAAEVVFAWGVRGQTWHGLAALAAASLLAARTTWTRTAAGAALGAAAAVTVGMLVAGALVLHGF